MSKPAHSEFFRFSLAPLSALLLSLSLVACGSYTPQLDAKFGDSVRATQALQTVNPTPPISQNPVTGVDARAAVNAQERYNDSFKAPPKSFEVLGIGGVPVQTQ
jgi:hypothetical protein